MNDWMRKNIEQKLKEILECAKIIKEEDLENIKELSGIHGHYTEELFNICGYCGRIKGLVDSISWDINHV